MVLKAPSFLADAMLGSVARKLRIFGFDTLYTAHAHDDEILKTGIEQGRVILTADKELFKRVVKAGARGVLVSGSGELEVLMHNLSQGVLGGWPPHAHKGTGQKCRHNAWQGRRHLGHQKVKIT